MTVLVFELRDSNLGNKMHLENEAGETARILRVIQAERRKTISILEGLREARGTARLNVVFMESKLVSAKRSITDSEEIEDALIIKLASLESGEKELRGY